VDREDRLRIALGLNLAIVVVQVVAGFAAGSLGLLADAGHNAADIAAVALSLVAVRLARRRPTPSRSYGWHRSTILAAQANAAVLLAATALIAFEAVRRLFDTQPVASGVVIVVAAVSLLVNGAAALVVHDHSHDLNMRSAMVHLVADALGSAGVCAAGVVMFVTGSNTWLDPAVSLVISAAIAWQAVKLIRASTDILLESTPSGLDVNALAAAMTAVAGVDSVHDLHVWSLSSEVRALSAHLVLSGHPTLEEAQLVGSEVKVAIGERFEIAHATLELECEHCMDEDDAEACAMPSAEAHAGHGH
jgi:cobalt-zinc-cadmium efflux system protein